MAERRQALEAEKAAKTQELKQRAEVARQRVLEQVNITFCFVSPKIRLGFLHQDADDTSHRKMVALSCLHCTP